MIQRNIENLSNAVAAICPDILARVNNQFEPFDEKKMWWELSSCILSSQVPYSLAVSAASVIHQKEILSSPNADYKKIYFDVLDVLKSPLIVDGRSRMYRFPESRAHFIATTYCAIHKNSSSLKSLMDSFDDEIEARDWLVCNVLGVGPKQASMFLRNVGFSFDLAILDRHVLNYMSALGMYAGKSYSISGMNQYQKYEAVLVRHAENLNCKVGLLDWAIWIVMRVANFKNGAILL